MCVALDIDATDLDPEDNELPVNLRSPKANPNTVMSSLSREKRMPFFKKVKLGPPNPLASSVRPHASGQLWLRKLTQRPSCLPSPAFLPSCHAPVSKHACLILTSLFPLFCLITAKQKQKSVSPSMLRTSAVWSEDDLCVKRRLLFNDLSHHHCSWRPLSRLLSKASLALAVAFYCSQPENQN